MPPPFVEPVETPPFGEPRPEGVGVVARFEVAKWLRKQQDVLDEATVEAIYAAARRPETWSSKSSG